MIFVRLRPDLPFNPSRLRIARQEILLDRPLAALRAFETGGAASPAPVFSPLDTKGRRTFLGEAPLGGQSRRIEALCGSGGYRVVAEGAGAFEISADGSLIVWTERAAVAPEALVEFLVGPALTLALALRGIFGLHASAVAKGGGAVAFIGKSGAGKSTLAAILGRRLADDFLPVGWSGGRLSAFPRFPQLKLASQPSLNHPEELPLRAVYDLSVPSEQAQVCPLPKREAALALVRHTVGARLFGPELLAAHLAFCGQVAEAVPVASLSYPRDPGIGAQVEALIL